MQYTSTRLRLGRCPPTFARHRTCRKPDVAHVASLILSTSRVAAKSSRGSGGIFRLLPSHHHNAFIVTPMTFNVSNLRKSNTVVACRRKEMDDISAGNSSTSRRGSNTLSGQFRNPCLHTPDWTPWTLGETMLANIGNSMSQAQSSFSSFRFESMHISTPNSAGTQSLCNADSQHLLHFLSRAQ
jgi:hypothetical protein